MNIGVIIFFIVLHRHEIKQDSYIKKGVIDLANKKGTRRLERVEIKGNPYNHLMNYPMNMVKEKIIYFLYDMRVATTSQLVRCLKYSANYVRENLSDMYINQLVYRDFPLIKRGKHGSSEAVYFLDNQGAYFLAANNGLEKREVAWDPRDNVVSIGAVRHSLDITEIRVCMEENSKDIKVHEFLGERRIGQIVFQYQGVDYTFKPDGRIVLYKKENEKLAKLSFYLEYDRGTESLKTFLAKIKTYEKFYSSKKINELYKNIHPAILIITNHPNRTNKLKELIEKYASSEINYYFKTLDDKFKKNPFDFLV